MTYCPHNKKEARDGRECSDLIRTEKKKAEERKGRKRETEGNVRI
jgi:hypothetical protein